MGRTRRESATWRENAIQKDVKGLGLHRKQIKACENNNTSNFLPEFCSYNLYLYNSKYLYFQILVWGKRANHQYFQYKSISLSQALWGWKRTIFFQWSLFLKSGWHHQKTLFFTLPIRINLRSKRRLGVMKNRIPPILYTNVTYERYALCLKRQRQLEILSIHQLVALRHKIHKKFHCHQSIFKRISISNIIYFKRFLLTVNTIAAWLKRRSTRTLLGILVLYFMNSTLIWGYFSNISILTSRFRR